MKSPLKVAVLQMATSDDIAQNAQKLHAAIDEAADGGAALLVVPECSLCGYLPKPQLDFGALQEAQDDLVAHCVARRIWFALGTTTRREGKWFNTALLFSREGDLAASYDKTELMPGDVGVFEPGDDLPVFRIGEWTVGLQICFDMRFPENWRILRRQGAELILHLSNASAGAGWKLPVLDGTMRCRAAENGMLVVSANDARSPQMMVSAICDADGRHLACAEANREMMITATLDRATVKDDYLRARRTDLWGRPQFRSLLLQ